MRELHVETQAQLHELCKLIRGSRWLAMDTEFMREKTYYPKFCLLQLCNGKVAASVDPLSLESLDPLVQVIYDPTTIKILHAGRQDLEIFHHLWKKLPTPLFDTQLAATLCGFGDQIGYGGLVHSVLGRELEKGYTRADWARRPLENTLLRYALDDVIYLGEVFEHLDKKLEKLQRAQWLEDDFEILTNPVTYNSVPEETWQRIKGRQKLKGVQLATLQALAAWRENRAVEADRPRRWIIKDETLLEIARHRPGDMKGLERIRGLEGGTLKRHGAELLDRIKTTAELPRSQWPREKNPPLRLTPNQEALTDLCMACLRVLSDTHKISPSAICNRRELEELVYGKADLDILKGWRGALAGQVLLKVLKGRCMPVIENGQLVIPQNTRDPA
ncbi:MAG: ribonuclease D [Gammaproteobacteria bacterium]|nr:ribonuclease D [Gammaproteobacteria bacterium]